MKLLWERNIRKAKEMEKQHHDKHRKIGGTREHLICTMVQENIQTLNNITKKIWRIKN
jgi:hypothetical protein